MTVENLIDQLVGTVDHGEQQAFLYHHREELNSEFHAGLKTRSDALLLEQPGRALEIAEVALRAASISSTPSAEAVAKWARGNALVCLGQHERALRDYSQACTIYAAQDKDRLAVARLQANMVTVLKNLGRYDEGLELADIARDALQPWGQSRYLAMLEMNLGSTCRLVGRYQDGLAAYERGRTIFAGLGDLVQTARMDINRARILGCLDHFSEAENLLLAAGRTLTEQGKVLPAARARLNQATLLSRQGHHRQALETYEQARAIFASLGAEADVAVIDLYRTYDYLALNLLPEALDSATEAGESLAHLEMPRYVALAAGNRAVAARRMGHYTEALDALRSARAIFAERGAMVEMALLDTERAVCLRESGDPATAAAVVTEAMQVLASHHLPLQTAQARLALADCLLPLGEVDRAESLYLLALDTLKEIPSLAWQAYDGLGRTAQAGEHTEAAYCHYQEAIACIETTEEDLGTDEFRAGFLDNKLEVYQRAVRVALTLGDLENAFRHAEQSKTGVWRDFVAQRPAEDSGSSQLEALRGKWHWLYNRLTRPDEDEDDEILRRAAAGQVRWAELRALERQIAEAKRASGRALERRLVPSLSAIQHCVPADTLLLDYYCTSEGVVAFLISATEVRTVEHLSPLESVERAINRWVFNIDSVKLATLDGQRSHLTGLLSEARTVLQTLYQLLVKPLEPFLDGHRTLWVIPHRFLWTVPFAALYDGKRYLTERFELACLPGVPILEQDRQGSALALTDAPVIAGYSEAGRLSCAVGEARAVAATVSGGRLLLEDQATRERLHAAAASCTLFHVACHGLFRTDAPLFSTLDLADGPLTAGEVEEWSMPQAQLVTLSACETGVNLSWGSDLLGLARGFFRAGARQLLVSLWAVDDVATAELMARFYATLNSGKSVVSALSEAQTMSLAQRQHPFFWGGFVALRLIRGIKQH